MFKLAIQRGIPEEAPQFVSPLLYYTAPSRHEVRDRSDVRTGPLFSPSSWAPLGWGFLQLFYLADGPWRWLILLGFPAIASAATYLGVRMVGWLFVGFAGDEPPDSQ